MERKTYNSHFLLENRAYKWTLPISTIVCVILLFLIEYNSYAPQNDIVPKHFSGIWFHSRSFLSYLEIVPVMILTSLSGYAMGAFSVLIFFIGQSFMDNHFAYHAFLLLLSSILANLPIFHHWYKNIWKTILTFALFSLLLGNGWNVLHAIIEAEPKPFLGFEKFHFFEAVPTCFIVCLFCYLYFNFFPEKVRSLFFTSSYENEDVQNIHKKLKERNFFGIDERMAMLYLMSVFLLFIAGHTFTYILISKITTYPWQAIVFTTRLTVLMAIFGTPTIMLTLSLVNQRITNPIMLMAQAAENSYVCHMNGKEKSKEVMPLVDLKSLDIKRADEIGILYNALVRAFENTNAYISNLEKEKQLETQLISAEEANRAKSEFLSNMSHEIRTPINAILGLDEMILRESNEEETKKYAVDIQSAGKNLLSLVNDILDFSKIEAGKMELVPVNYHLSSVVNDLVNMVSKRAHDKNLSLNIDVDKTIPHLLFGDDVRIKQCILNLLTNAVKYTKKGSVTLAIKGEKLSEQHINLTIHVIDTGNGIKEEDLPKLFTAFQRIEENKNRTIEGTGLGLNIVKNLLGLMESKLEVKSEYGKGSDFYFTVRQRVADWQPMGDFNDIYERSLIELAKYKEGFHAPKAKILVVDDTALNLTVVKGLLKQTKIQIETATSGQETLNLITKNRYDIIFLDHRMPGMDGIETFKAMQTLNTNINIGVPCIALTANAIAGAKEMYLEVGFSDYLSKPIESKKLEAMIVKYLPESLIEPCCEETAQAAKDENNSPDSEEIKNRFANITGISLSNALKFAGNADILEQAIKEFYCTIDKKADDIERFAREKDFKNYTILVHALKSSARLIGACQLSADAAYLEKCGDSENEEEIREKTPALLALYRSYKEHLAAIHKDDEEEKEEMSEEEYQDAMKSIKECAEAFDFDTIDTILSMLSAYSPPKAHKEEFATLSRAAHDVDQAAILKLLS